MMIMLITSSRKRMRSSRSLPNSFKRCQAKKPISSQSRSYYLFPFIIVAIYLVVFSCQAFAEIPSSEIKGKILFDESHHQFWTACADAALADYASELENAGYKVDILTDGPITDKILSNYDVLAFPNGFVGKYDFSQGVKFLDNSEIEAIKKFVRDDGKGIALFECGWSWVKYTHLSIDKAPVNQLGKLFGITLNDDIIHDPTNYYDNLGDSCPVFHKPFIKDHEITKDVTTISNCEGVPSSLDLRDSKAKALITGDGDSYSSKLKKGGRQPPFLAVTEYGKGKVVFFGQTGLLTNLDGNGDGIKDLYEFDNLKLGINIVDWLANVNTNPSLLINNIKIEETDVTVDGVVSFKINSNINNNGNIVARDLIVKFFDGDPGNDGKFIGDQRISLLRPGEGIEASIWWKPEKGMHDIYVASGNSKADYQTNIDFKIINDVPGYNQYMYERRMKCPGLCGPVASACVIGYWDKHGFSNFINGIDVDALISDLKIREGTICCSSNNPPKHEYCGTLFLLATSGLVEFVIEKGYYQMGVVPTTTDWQKLKDYLNEGIPLIGFSGTSNHFMPLIGYIGEGSNNKWVYTGDPAGTRSLYDYSNDLIRQGYSKAIVLVQTDSKSLQNNYTENAHTDKSSIPHNRPNVPYNQPNNPNRRS
jgi:hypothetical protein